MLPGKLPHAFRAVAVLALSGSLLDLLVRYQEPGFAVAGGEAHAVGVVEVALERSGERGARSVVRKIREYRRVEVAIGRKSVAAGTGGRAARGVLGGEKPAHRIEAAAIDGCGTVEPGRGVAGGIDLHHAAQLAAELGGDAAGIGLHRLHVVGFHAGGKGGRAVILHGKAVHDVLRFVFGLARVEHAVGLEQPAGLCGYQVDQAAAGRPLFALLDLPGPGVVGGADAVRVQQGGGFGHLDGGFDRLNPKSHFARHRQGGADFDQLGMRNESGLSDLQTVEAVGQVLENIAAPGSELDRDMRLGGLIHEVHGGGDAGAGSVLHGQAQFTGTLLSQERNREDQQAESARKQVISVYSRDDAGAVSWGA